MNGSGGGLAIKEKKSIQKIPQSKSDNHASTHELSSDSFRTDKILKEISGGCESGVGRPIFFFVHVFQTHRSIHNMHPFL